MITKSPSTSDRRVAVACLLLALGAAALSFVGVSARDGITTLTATTIRGESVEWVASGPYAFNALRVVAEGVGWDWVTLVLAAPVLAGVSVLVWRGSLRARAVASGRVAYLFYQYLQYATVWALGPLFPGFIVMFSASLWTLVALVSGLAVDLGSRPWPDAFPRVGLAILCFSLVLILVLMWTGRIAGALGGQVQGVLYGQATLVVQALDLGLVVPLGAFVGALALGRRPWALVLGPLLLGKALFMSLAIAAMLVVAWSVEGTLDVVPLAIFGGAGLVSVLLGARVLRVL